MGFSDDEHISFKFSYGFLMPVEEIPLVPGESGFDCKYRLIDLLTKNCNLPHNFIDVCVNDYDCGGKGPYSGISGNIFICLKGCELQGEDIGNFNEVPGNVLNPPEEYVNIIRKLASGKRCGFYIFAYSA